MNARVQCPDCGAILSTGAFRDRCPICQLQMAIQPPAPESWPETSIGGIDALRGGGPRIGDYQIIKEIGRGGMGIVYKARQLSLNRVVALKMSLVGPQASAASFERFRTEAETAARLHHPNIVAIHEIGQHEGRLYFSMDFVEGRNLVELVGDSPLSAERAAAILKSVADAVALAQEQGIIHRDLKPSNILIDATFQPRVTDFGLAKRMIEEAHLTATGEIFGSPSFCAPEQAAGRHAEVGPRSDVYSLGAILYFLLTGRPPLLGETLEETLYQVLHVDPVPPRLLRPAIPADLQTICLKCLEKNPHRRYATARSLADDLSRFLRREPILARPVTPVEKAWRWCQRNPGLAALGSMVLVLLAAIVGIIILARVRVKAQEQVVRRNAYAADMRLTQEEIAVGNYARAAALLNQHWPQPGQPDLRGWEWRYFWGQIRSDEIATLGAHRSAVVTTAFSPDGVRLATGDMTGTIKLWDVQARRILAEGRHRERIDALAFSPDGRTLASSGLDGEIRFWDGARLAQAAAPIRMGHRVLSLAISSERKLTSVASNPETGMYGGTLARWNLQTGRQETALPIQVWWRASISPGGEMLATGGMEGDIRLWNLHRHAELKSWVAHSNSVSALTFSPDERLLVSGGFDRIARVWELSTRRPIATLRAHQDTVSAAAFSPDANTLVTASFDQTIRLWDTRDWTESLVLRGQGSEIWALAFSPRLDLVATGDKAGVIKLWSTTEPPRRVPSTRLINHGPFFAPGSDGRGLVGMKGGRDVAVLDLHTGATNAQFRWPDESPSAFSISANGRYAAFATSNGTVTCLNLVSGEPPQSTHLGHGGIALLAFSPDLRYLAACVLYRQIEILNLATMQPVGTLERPSRLVRSHLVFSPDSRCLAAGFDDGATLIWDASQRAVCAVLEGHKLWVTSVGFSPDGRLIAAAGEDGYVKLWETRSGRAVTTLGFGTDAFWWLAWSPDGRRLATGTGQGMIRVWDWAGGQEVATLKGHQQLMRGLAFLPGGDDLISFAAGEVIQWHAPSFKETDGF